MATDCKINVPESTTHLDLDEIVSTMMSEIRSGVGGRPLEPDW